MGDTQGRVDEILARIEAWTEEHAAHLEAGEADCGCDLYDDVIYQLPEFDPLDWPNLRMTHPRRYVLLDGTVIDGSEVSDGRPVWRVISPVQELPGPRRDFFADTC
jgi:hypothetical protein